MDLMDKAQKRAILTIDKEYVFNDIYFGEEGMTSTSHSTFRLWPT